MKRRLFTKALVLSAACSALFLAGCSTTETRISAHPEIYNGLSASDRALVAEGKIRNGMSQNAVFLAWGSPDAKTSSVVLGRPAETWVYTAIASSPYPYGWGPGYYGRGYYGFGYVTRHRHSVIRSRLYYDPFYYPFYSSQTTTYPERTVSFQNGRVVAYQFLNSPRGVY
ncbi:MAG: hypothetical protein V7609_1209 [Verrucomicrobiota bacterium]